MTDDQRKHWFMPSWTLAFRANWIRDRGCILPLDTRPDSEWLQLVEDAAATLAFHRHTAATEEIYRHACGVVANKVHISSQKMTNDQLDLTECVFRLLTNPLDLEAIMDWQNPERMVIRRLIGGIERLKPYEYVATISSSMYGTREWKLLPVPKLRNLSNLLWRQSVRAGNPRNPRVPPRFAPRKRNPNLEPF